MPRSDRPPAASSDASAWDWAQVMFLSANLVWTTLCLGGFLPGSRILMSALTSLMLAGHFLRPDRKPGHPAARLWLPFLIYAALNAAFLTPTQWLGWTDWLGWAQMLAVYWVVLGLRPGAAKACLFWVLACLAIVLASMALYQHFGHPTWMMFGRVQASQFLGRAAGSFGIPNSLGAFMILLIPALAFRTFRGRAVTRLFAGLGLVCAVTALVLAISRGAWLSLAAAVAIAPVTTPRIPLGKRLLMAACLFAAVFLAGFSAWALSPSTRARFFQLAQEHGEHARPILWRAAWGIFKDNPIVGGGAGSFDFRFEKFRPEGFRDEPFWAHCDYLNLLCDFGGIGFLLAAGAAGLTLFRCRRDIVPQDALGMGLLAFALHLTIDFHLEIPALAMAFSTLAGLYVSERWKVNPPVVSSLGHRALGCVAAASAAAVFAWTIPRYRADALRWSAKDKIEKMAAAAQPSSKSGPLLLQLSDRMRQATQIDPGNPQAWSDRSYVDSLLTLAYPERQSELATDARVSSENAVRLCVISPEYWVRLGVAKDMQGNWLEGGNCFIKALALAPVRADVWYFWAYHLSQDPAQIDEASAASDYCLRLDPSFRLGQLLQERLASRARPHP